jgi:DNA-binding beta-propeller fold protein YncE
MATMTNMWKSILLATLCSALPICADTVHHYEYVFQASSLFVYDADNGFGLVKTVPLPTGGNPRGAIASAVTGMLYVSYGPDDSSGNGSIFKYDLVHDVIVWNKTYSFGIDSMSISPDGSTIYMPTGELASGGIWEIIDASTGNVTGSIDSGGVGPHNTVLNTAGTHVYMGPRGSNYLVEADAATHSIIRQIGPITPAHGTNGVRPFTINSAETFAFITATGLLGFQVGDLSTGNILYQVPIQGFSWDGTGGGTAPSHGISISPDNKEVYVMDAPNSYVHVYDVTGLPGSAPVQVADIPLTSQVPGIEQGCSYDCYKAGWLHHSRDGRYVFVGDSGDVIDTATRQPVAVLPAMANTRIFIEIDFQNGVPVWDMPNRSSIGTVSTPTPTAISHVQSTAVEGTAEPSVSAAFPNRNTAVNLIVAFVRMSTATQKVSLTDTAGNLYTDAVSKTHTVDGHQVHLFYARNIVGAASNTVTATFSGTNNHPWIAVYEYSGLSQTNPLDQASSALGGGFSATTPAVSSQANANELIFAESDCLPASRER